MIDVLIVGLGPVGQLLALLLDDLGVSVVAVDQSDGVYDLPRAAVVDDEVLRIFQAAGVDREVMQAAQVQPAVSFVDRHGRATEVFRPAHSELGHPPLASIHQPSFERVMVEALERRAVDVRWGVRLETLDRRADHVRAWVCPAAGGPSEELRARFLVGCDGGRSPVRSRLEVPFGGSTFAQRWLVVDTLVDRPMASAPHPHFVGDPARPIVSLPMSPGRHRWEWMLHPGEERDDLDLDALLAPWIAGERVEVEREVVYTFHARTAARWRVGRVLLAGDAAHVMPPFVGQGFSSGARDAANLAWKLDAVLRGAPARLLDTYEAERRPHVTSMQRLAVRWGGVVQTTSPRVARVRDAVQAGLVRSGALDWLSGHAKPLPTYGRGAFAETPHRLPFRRTVGALFPQPGRLDDDLGPGWAAVTTSPAAAHVFRDAGIAVHEVPADAWLAARSLDFALLRPDRFVYACGTDADAGRAVAAVRHDLGTGLHSAPLARAVAA